MKRILVLCPGPWDRQALADPALRARYEPVLAGEELYDLPLVRLACFFDIFSYARRVAQAHRGARLAGVIGTGDYPGCMLAALVAVELGLPTPPASAVVRLSHKFYSREIQRRVVPEATPAFEAIDPLAPREPRTLPYPFFVKPVKGTMSFRAQRVSGPAALRQALRFSLAERITGQIMLKPFSQLLRTYTDGRVPAHAFIAEEPLSEVQVTVDGFVEGGRVVVMGIVDSVMYPGTISFQRFELPSRLPAGVQARMVDIVTRLMAGAGFDQSCFNVELFYDPARDTIHVIEVNPRMSYQFSSLYERVSGKSTFDIQLALAAGEPVGWTPGQGPDRAAASFVMRRFTDARVLSVPTREQIARAEQRYEGTTVKVLCAVGDRLSTHYQDVGSFRYAIVNMSAPTYDELHARYREVERMLPFAFGRSAGGAAMRTIHEGGLDDHAQEHHDA